MSANLIRPQLSAFPPRLLEAIAFHSFKATPFLQLAFKTDQNSVISPLNPLQTHPKTSSTNRIQPSHHQPFKSTHTQIQSHRPNSKIVPPKYHTTTTKPKQG